MTTQDQQKRTAFFELRNTVKAFVSGIEKLTPKEREQRPSGRYGETYNALLGEAKKLRPTVNPALWPPEVKVSRFPGRTESDVPYIELFSFAEMIINTLEADDLMSVSE